MSQENLDEVTSSKSNGATPAPYNLGFIVFPEEEGQSAFINESFFKEEEESKNCKKCGKPFCCDVCRMMCM